MRLLKYFYRLIFGVFVCLLHVQVASAFEGGASLRETDVFAPYPLSVQYDVRDEDLGILSIQDRKLYNRIFDLQRVAKWAEARSLIAQIENPILLGYVDFQRLMHPTGYRSSFTELADWLDQYTHQVGADRVYKLAKRRRGESARKITPPIYSGLSLVDEANTSVAQNETNETRDSRSKTVRGIQWQVHQWVSKGNVSFAWEQLKKPKWRNKLSDEEYIQTLGDIAKGYVIYQRDALAIKAADEALLLNANYPSQAYWWAGLAAWRMGDMETAAAFFTFLGNHDKAPTALAAASSFWAWRSLLRLERITEAHQALVQVTADPYSFYGQLARVGLNMDFGLDFALEGNAQSIQGLIQRFPILQRILALAEAGQFGFAQAEVARLKFGDNPALILSMIYIADRAGLANMAIKLGRKLRRISGTETDISRYPVPRWQYRDSYYIDRALLYALIRKESLFTTKATSRVGARGLMQLMPATARLMQRRLKIKGGDIYEPGMNLLLGQEYLKHLMTLPEINYNLIYTLIGYNAGPGRLRDWRESVPLNSDPLLFIETIPVRETREYAETVLADLWIYRARLGQSSPSLYMLLEGKWPQYQRLDQAVSPRISDAD